MKRKRYLINVHAKGTRWREPGEFIETIRRALHSEMIGNFNPFFCTYKGNKRNLVQSLAGDVSDPFRREASYADTFFIEV